jgi:hypothetical protein
MTAQTPATESVQTPVCFPAWRALRSRAEAGVPHLRTLLADPNRHTLSAVAEGTGIRLDYSRQALDDRVLSHAAGRPEPPHPVSRGRRHRHTA